MPENHKKLRVCIKSYEEELKTWTLGYAQLFRLTTENFAVYWLLKMPYSHWLDARWKKGISVHSSRWTGELFVVLSLFSKQPKLAWAQFHYSLGKLVYKKADDSQPVVRLCGVLAWHTPAWLILPGLQVLQPLVKTATVKKFHTFPSVESRLLF